MIPCTPYGIMKMFEAYDIDLTGKRAVVMVEVILLASQWHNYC